jgi:RNase H-fold protein (predicted Holliday junction resolvase)
MDAFVGGTGGSMNKCKYCKGMGQAPSSNSASERHTYAVASDRAVNTVENAPINSINKMNFGNAADHITINLPVPKEQSIGSRESQRTKYEEMLEKKYNSDHKKGRTHSVSPNTPNNERKNTDNSSLLQQIR